MSTQRFLEGEFVYLSGISTDDADVFARFMNSEDARILARSRRDVVYESAARQLVENYQKHEEGFIIRRNADDAPIGYGLIMDRDHYNREASLAIVIGEREDRGKGYGQDAMKLLLRHAFIDLNLESVYLSAYEYNAAAIHVYEKLGFRRVGTRRHSRIVGDRIYNEVILDMIAEEYFAKYGNAAATKYGI